MTTINKEEVHKFSHSNWWNYNSGESLMLHRLNTLRMKFLQNLVEINGLDILDVGCGGGIASESLTRAGGRVVGIDASPEAIECGRAHAKLEGLDIDYQAIPIEEFSTTTQFDVVFANDIIEHVDCVPLFLENLQKHTKQGGLVIISTINKNPLSFAFAKVMAEYILRLVPKGTHDFQKFVSPKQIKELLPNCTHIQTQGFSYNPVTKEFFFEPTALVNYFIVFQKNAN